MELPPIKLRDLGQFGILSDPEPTDIPLNAWSAGNNVVFRAGSVWRSPFFREVEVLDTASPMFVYAIQIAGDYDRIVIAARNGSLYTWRNGLEADATPGSFTTADSDVPFTGCTLSTVAYINRPTHVPYRLLTSGSSFVSLPGWDSSWRCRVLRAFSGQLWALNVTKAGTDYPTMLKASDIAPNSGSPTSWDHTDPTKSAVENILTEMVTPIVDGLALRNALMVYCEKEVWIVEKIGGAFRFGYRRLFGDVGIINTNCVVEVNGYHYVFDQQDIYRHQGTGQWQSIVDGRVRRSIFDTLNVSEAEKCFVTHSPRHQEVLFCYPSRHPDCKWASTTGCNRAAVYNYSNDTWSFRDLPSVTSAAFGSIATTATWSTVEPAWGVIGGTWGTQGDGLDRHMLMVNRPLDGLSARKLLALDGIDVGTNLTLPLDLESVAPAYVQRIGLDLDEAQMPLPYYKVVTAVYPQLRLYSQPLQVRIGGALYQASSQVLSPPTTLDPATGYKLDVVEGGRSLAMDFSMPTAGDFRLSGIDLRVVVTGTI